VPPPSRALEERNRAGSCCRISQGLLSRGPGSDENGAQLLKDGLARGRATQNEKSDEMTFWRIGGEEKASR